MNSKLWIRKALTMCSMVAILATYSMAALASNGKPAGEILVTGNNSAGDAAAVTVNGEPVKSGRTIFSSSTISTPDGAGAIVNLAKAGRIELAPNTTFALTFDDKSISGDLTAGSITVLSAGQSVGVKTLSGDVVQLNAGDTATANAAGASQTTAPQTSVHNHSGLGPWWIAIFAGSAAVLIWTASKKNNDEFGAGATGVSPVR